jgi:DNA-binding NtrC family response regulator
MLTAYRWPGNVRQLRNIVEQMSVIEQTREVDAARRCGNTSPTRAPPWCPPERLVVAAGTDSINERELIFKFLFDMKNDLNALKEQVRSLGGGQPRPHHTHRYSRNTCHSQSMPAPGTVSILPHNTRRTWTWSTPKWRKALSLEEKRRR